MKRLITVCVACLAACAVVWGASQGTPQQQLQKAMAWLQKIEPEFSPEAKANVPALKAILERYYLDNETLRASEQKIAEAFIATMPSEGDLTGRGSNAMHDLDSLLGGSGPVKKTTTKPKTAPKTTKPKSPVPGITSKPVYSAMQTSAPGGKKIGVVQVRIGGRKKTVVEIVSATTGLSLQKRAQVVADRMGTLSRSHPLWWTQIKAGAFKGEQVVLAPGAPHGFIVTADQQFARECGVTPQQLARQLVAKIRSTFDPEAADTFGGRATTPEDQRQAAIDLRQSGDDLYAASPSQAEAKYKAAIENDPTYGVPYLRLADLYLGQRRSADARQILQLALQVPSLDASARADVEKRLAKIR